MGSDGDHPVTTVQNLDLERYMGRWYEISRMPSRFQPSDTTNTRATYSLKPDGTVSVLNETFKPDGSRASISGKAYKNDPSSPDAKFTVQFWVPPFLPVFPVKGDYWVIDLAEDYSHALIGQAKRENLWVLSREPSLPDEIYARLLQKAQSVGYDVSMLRKTTHLPDVGNGENAKEGMWWWLSALFGMDKGGIGTDGGAQK